MKKKVVQEPKANEVSKPIDQSNSLPKTTLKLTNKTKPKKRLKAKPRRKPLPDDFSMNKSLLNDLEKDSKRLQISILEKKGTITVLRDNQILKIEPNGDKILIKTIEKKQQTRYSKVIKFSK